MAKESIIKISTPILKAPTLDADSEVQSDVNPAEEINLPEELQQPHLDAIYFAEPVMVKVSNMNSGGWKASDILREIRLDSFDMGG